MVKITWTEVSLDDLKEIFDYISEDSIRYANITVNKIYQGTQVISVNPHSGRIVPVLNKTSVRELIIGNYRVIYRIKSGVQIDILRVYHSARHLKKNNIK
ncbi:MAG: type II toxin-antitoxin system RelE/ParE family toxin [Prolixibacteraceae bacterium]|jgi:addiction module RelE/StbE family toxin|nr:type II toxin-antitoxin system RelE/ParE family toxin [Prolixibacteraceae bacterium]